MAAGLLEASFPTSQDSGAFWSQPAELVVRLLVCPQEGWGREGWGGSGLGSVGPAPALLRDEVTARREDREMPAPRGTGNIWAGPR